MRHDKNVPCVVLGPSQPSQFSVKLFFVYIPALDSQSNCIWCWDGPNNYIQSYHANRDIWCLGESKYKYPWCPVIWGEETMGAQVTISNTSRVADQVQALNCAALGSNPRAGPAHYQEVRSGFHFWSFSHFFLFDSLGGVLENLGTDRPGARIAVGTIRRGTTVA